MALETNAPKYEQITTILKQRISDGTYPAGSELPSEARLCEEFETSRTTVIKSLSALQQHNWIESHQGKRRIVIGPPAEQALVLVEQTSEMVSVIIRNDDRKVIAVVNVPL